MGSKVELPEVQQPKPVRLPNQNAFSELRQRQAEALGQRGGRQSTILSQALRSLTGSTGYLGR